LGINIPCFFLGTNDQCNEVIGDFEEDNNTISTVLKALENIQFKPSLRLFLEFDIAPVSKASVLVPKSDVTPSKK